MNNGTNKKKHICILIILLICISIVVFILIFKQKANKEEIEEYGDDYISEFRTYDTSKEAHFNINSCMTTYLNSINNKNKVIQYEYNQYDELIAKEDDEEFNNRLYALLTTNFIKKNGITKENVCDYVKTFDEKTLFVPLEVYSLPNDSLKSFIVHGLIENMKDFSVIEDFYAIVNIEIEDNLFSIEPIYGKYKNISEIKVKSVDKTIAKNQYNSFQEVTITTEEMAKEYITLYKRIALGSPEKMYDFLDDEYRNKKFENVENFKNYIEENKDLIKGIRLEKFSVTEEDDYTQYICIDQYNNYYIFKEKGVFQYKAILDTYTIDIPQFIEKYYGIEPTNKVALNIQKIFDAMNDKDYNYIYSKLADGFKQNYFPTVESFETYVKKNFYSNNEVEYLYYEKESEEYYSYTIKVYDKNSNKSKILKIIMDLQETTNFVFSFNVD